MKKFYRDHQFYLLLTLGPLVWVLLALWLPVSFRLDRFLAEPWWFVSSVLIYPVLEEIVFRGLLLDWLEVRLARYRYGPLSLANLLTSLLFVLAHLVRHSWQWSLAVFFPSLIFGYAKERHQTLWSPILLHIFYNLGYFAFFVVLE